TKDEIQEIQFQKIQSSILLMSIFSTLKPSRRKVSKTEEFSSSSSLIDFFLTLISEKMGKENFQELFSFCDRKCQIATNKEKGANNVIDGSGKELKRTLKNE
ncbi:hypothetical protein DERF_005095, partial [Dermatophagoides farinae]